MKVPRARFRVRRMMTLIATVGLAMVPIREVVRHRYRAYYERALISAEVVMAKADVLADRSRRGGDMARAEGFSQASRAMSEKAVHYARLKQRYESHW
jgi:hypothetical protein